MAASVFRVDNQTVKHESDLSTCESFGFETAGLDQGESTGMSTQEFTTYVHSSQRSFNVNAFHVLCFVELLHLPHPVPPFGNCISSTTL